MDNKEALAALKEGGTLLFVGMPEGSEFGIDLNTWKTGPKFRGVKMIPAGLHFIYFSAVSKEQAVAPRTGFFHFFAKGEFLIKHYDSKSENIVDRVTEQSEIDAAQENMRDLDRFLGAYPQDEYKSWFALTNFISKTVLNKLEPLNGLICSASELIPTEGSTSSERLKDPDKHKSLPSMCLRPGTEIRFTAIPEKKYPEGSSPQEITRHNLDSSFLLSVLIETHENSDDFLGELQFAFVCFLVGQVFDSFEQWKKLVHVVCSSETAVVKHSQLYHKFISLLYHQVNHVPSDMFVDIVESKNFLTVTLNKLFCNVAEAPLTLDMELRRKANRFRRHLTKKFKWSFLTENEDDAPVVVETE